MFNPSNLYAEKVFAEYPLELWSLDDATDYVSLINEQQRNISNWSVSRTGIGSTAVVVTDVTSTFAEEDAPIEDTAIYKVLTNPTSGFLSATITLTSNTTFDPGEEKEFSIGVPILADPFTTGVRIGYKVGSTTTWSESMKTKDFIWSTLSATFSNQDALSTPANIVVEISFDYSGTDGSTYNFYINGVSVGIRSEEFSGTSLGITPQAKPQDFPITTESVMVYPANPYSLSDNYGYYTVDRGVVLRARNSTIPLVYGASSSTILSKADGNNPSLVIPGTGFLNNSGKLFTRTFECWLRFNSKATTFRRIIGPVSSTSTDGLYVNGPFFFLKVGDNIGSYFVGEWSRPMLIQIVAQEKAVSLKVNAETVISLSLNLSEQNFEPMSNDWIGFYAYNDVTELEVDCVAIYPYAISDKIAKKRFVYGQGVVLPESTNTSYGGSSVVLDYSFADYDKNHSFPKNADWGMGLTKNLYVDKQRIKLPEYSLPKANFGKNTFQDWLNIMQNVEQDQEMLDINRAKFYMKPTYYIDGGTQSLFDIGDPYFSFNNLNILYGSRTAGMYFVLKNNSAISNVDMQTLFYIEDYLTGKSFEICASSEDIVYFLNGEQIHSQHVRDGSDPTIKAVAGINIDTLKNISADAFSLFSDPSRLRVYVGGLPNPDSPYKTFTGPIYEFGFLSQSDISKVSSSFDSNGYADFSAVSEFESLIPAYKVVGTHILDKFILDISSSGTWEDFVPLSVFKKELKRLDGTVVDDVSMIQINLDYPIANIFDGSNYDTSKSMAKFYASFQEMQNGVILTDNRTIVPMNKNGSVFPTSSWATEKYEIVDGAIIGMPDFGNVDIDNVAIIISMEISVGSLSINPVIIRAIDMASLTFDEESLRPIGTKYGTKIYPFKEIEDESYVSSKSNHFKIYKGTSPYLYLSSKTGVQVVGDIKSPSENGYVHRGVVTKINESLSASYDVSSIMMSIRYQDTVFPTTKLPVFEIEGHILKDGSIKNIYLRFYIESVNLSNNRGRIFCEASIDGGSFSTYTDIIYYWNGNIVSSPQISSGEWGMLSLSFTNFLKFPAVSGTFEIIGKLLVDNVSIYKISETTASASTTINTWNTSLYGSGTWENVMDTDGFEDPNDPVDDNLWFNTYSTIKTSQKPVDQTEIYRSYLGTNKIIVDTSDSGLAIRPESCEYILYNAVEWKTSVLNAL